MHNYNILTAKEQKTAIAKQLKHYRLKQNLSIDEVLTYLSEQHIKTVPRSTFYAWESGQSAPCLHIFLSLCQLYGISDISSAFSYQPLTVKEEILKDLSFQEQRLIFAYRAHPDLHHAIHQLLAM